MQSALFRLAKWLGIFHLSGWLYRRKLLILAYHGFSVADEHLFRPTVFMRAETFALRMRTLARLGYRVLPLEEALSRLYARTLPPRSVVITVDDGFKSVATVAAPILKRLNLPATVYVTSYYVERNNPVYGLAVQYICWRARISELAVADVLPQAVRDRMRQLPETLDVPTLVRLGEKRLSEEEREDVLRRLGACLNVSYEEIRSDGRLTLMSADEVRALALGGWDVQLHTHRHRLPPDSDEIRREIGDNRRVLEPLAGRRLRHLCYPSGIWAQEHLNLLGEHDIASATTCVRGFNDHRAHPLALRRCLDNDSTPQIVFEAEICGLKDRLRSLKRQFIPGRPSPFLAPD
jgi:peptidoglycan/xylan/chitin deacetylase (PgdA/CDA1 family)